MQLRAKALSARIASHVTDWFCLCCSVVECSDLSLKCGSCDPFAVVTMVYSNGKEETKRTKVKKKTNSPKFDESFVFEVSTSTVKKEVDYNCYK